MTAPINALPTKVVGMFAKHQATKLLSLMVPKDTLTLIREPNNQYDANAIGVWWNVPTAFKEECGLTEDLNQIGYLPRDIAAVLADRGLVRCEKDVGSPSAIIVHYSDDVADEAPAPVRVESTDERELTEEEIEQAVTDREDRRLD